MNFRTFEEAAAMGLGQAWREAFGGKSGAASPPVVTEPRKGQWAKSHKVILPADPEAGTPEERFDSKTELHFWRKLEQAFRDGVFAEIHHHNVRVKVISDNSWLTPDFMALDHKGRRFVWDTKGNMKDRDRLRLIDAAARYPEWQWATAWLCWKPWHWECRAVTAKGIGKDVWCPSWLSGARAM